MPRATPLETTRLKAAFVFRYFMERSLGHDGHGIYRSVSLEATTTYDDGTDFCVDFAEAFPGKKPDPNHTLASHRLSKLLRTMAADGQLVRWRLGNEIDLPGTPRWQYVYQVPDNLMTEIKTGKTTPENLASRWLG